MKVLSLFDGISCGMLALQRAGIPVECYDAFEIDKYAVTVSKRNFPVIVHHGNVYDGDFTKFQGYDLLLGGSPCTYWSIAKKDREVDCNGEGFRLRKRCYWTNIPFASFPADKGILLKDVLESGVAWQDKSYCMTASYDGAVLYNTLERKQRTMVAEPIPINTYQGSDKSRTVMAGYHKYGEATIIKNSGFNGGTTAVAMPVGAAQRGRYVDGEKTEQHIEVREDGKSNCLTTVQKDSLVCSPVRVGHYGKGGQGQRIYSIVGKSVTLSANGGGQGAKTGLYKIDLPDGDYVIRKLTPIEAERLQTLPDNYTAGISNTQRYKCIGNGWTVDVIAHILGGLHNA